MEIEKEVVKKLVVLSNEVKEIIKKKYPGLDADVWPALNFNIIKGDKYSTGNIDLNLFECCTRDKDNPEDFICGEIVPHIEAMDMLTK
jgi:hypothetical protein